MSIVSLIKGWERKSREKVWKEFGEKNEGEKKIMERKNKASISLLLMKFKKWVKIHSLLLIMKNRSLVSLTHIFWFKETLLGL